MWVHSVLLTSAGGWCSAHDAQGGVSGAMIPIMCWCTGYCCTEGVTSWWLQATLLPGWPETACLCNLRMCAVHCQCRDGLWWIKRSCASLSTQGLLAVSVFTILILKAVFRFSYNAFVFSSVFYCICWNRNRKQHCFWFRHLRNEALNCLLSSGFWLLTFSRFTFSVFRMWCSCNSSHSYFLVTTHPYRCDNPLNPSLSFLWIR